MLRVRRGDRAVMGGRVPGARIMARHAEQVRRCACCNGLVSCSEYFSCEWPADAAEIRCGGCGEGPLHGGKCDECSGVVHCLGCDAVVVPGDPRSVSGECPECGA